jgi:RNA polymerase sigma-70 factor (ECF subfamily)
MNACVHAQDTRVETQELDQTRINVLVRAREGDFAEFARIYVPFVYAHARRIAADEHSACDVAQDALLDLVRRMKHFQYDPAKRFRHFVRRIVRRRQADYFRRRRERSLESVASKRGIDPEEVAELSDGNESQRVADYLLDLDWLRACLAAAQREVRSRVRPNTYRAFQLVVVEGESVESAARILGQTRNQVAQNKHRVAVRLRDKLQMFFGRSDERCDGCVRAGSTRGVARRPASRAPSQLVALRPTSASSRREAPRVAVRRCESA